MSNLPPASHWVVTAFGIISTTIQFLSNIFIAYKCIFKGNLFRKSEFQLIFYRVVLDILNGLIYGSYLILSIPSFLEPDFLPFDYLFFMGLLANNVLETRSYLAAAIAVERALATLFPIQFYRYRSRIPSWPLFGFCISAGLFGSVMLFGICGNVFPLNKNCFTFICASSKCYQNYLGHSKTVYGTINAIFSIILCGKLFVLNNRKSNTVLDLKKANYICLTDGLSSLIFELIPSLLLSYNIVDLLSIGPMIGALRATGRVCEALVFYKLMWRRETADISTATQMNSVSARH